MLPHGYTCSWVPLSQIAEQFKSNCKIKRHHVSASTEGSARFFTFLVIFFPHLAKKKGTFVKELKVLFPSYKETSYLQKTTFVETTIGDTEQTKKFSDELL